MTPAEVTEKLGLQRMRDRNWYVNPSNALSGDGLFEGIVYCHDCVQYVCIFNHLIYFVFVRSYMAHSKCWKVIVILIKLTNKYINTHCTKYL